MNKISIWHQYCLPQHFLSRLLGRIANIRCKFIKNAMIKAIIKIYKVNMNEALVERAEDYPTFNQFFIRHLKASARPFPHNNLLIASPADGVISQLGQITEGRLIQAKGHDFSLMELLGGETSSYKEFIDGLFATIYLSPKDYHRIHMPLSGNLRQMTYIPGKLFSVSPKTTQMVPELFARNERVVCWFDSEHGPFASRALPPPGPAWSPLVTAKPYKPGTMPLISKYISSKAMKWAISNLAPQSSCYYLKA